jgi:hypothetical protein
MRRARLRLSPTSTSFAASPVHRLQGHNCALSWSVARMAQLAGRAAGLEVAKQSGGASAVSCVHSLSMGFSSAARAMGSVACRSTRG